jgi:colicin import membrane protein
MFSSQSDKDFNQSLLISFAAHAGVFLFAFFAGPAVMGLFQNNDNVEIIRSSVRVDVVGMPKLTVQELKQLQNEVKEEASSPEADKSQAASRPKEESEDIIKANDLVIQEKGESNKKSSFQNLLNNYSSKKVAAKENRAASTKGNSKNLDELILEGNRLSKGGALVGDFSDGESSEFSQYVQGIPDIIRPFWNLPSYLKEKGLKCRIRVYIAATGKLLKVEVFESSGALEYDSRAEKAVRDASPFPAPSVAVGARLTKSGIILGFPL